MVASWLLSGLLTCAVIVGASGWAGRAAADEPAAKRFELVLRGGVIHDGGGGEPRTADVGIRQGKIAAIGALEEAPADVVVDCRGLVVAPGFIDLHTHSDSPIVAAATRGNVNYLMQGCTTVVTGNCGSGPVDAKSYLDKVDQLGAGTHVIHLLPQGSLRDQVLGKERRKPTDAEVAKMRELADRAMLDGVFGMSTGLIYVPSMFAETDELVEIASVVGRRGGFYASHIRGEGTGLLDAVHEALEIGRRGQLPVHVSHFKAAGKDAWGTLHLAVDAIEKARTAGQRVTADQYPYIASSTSLEATLLPAWSREGGRKSLQQRLDDPGATAKIRDEVAKKIATSYRILIASYRPRRDWVGKSLDEIARLEQREPVDIVLEIERQGGAGVVNFSMQEEEVRLAMKLPWVATASDGGAKIPSADKPHPRSYGTFARKVGRYVDEHHVMSLAAAVRSASGLPADILQLDDRGYVKVGMSADLAVFDPAAFRDEATFEQPQRLAVGMRYVYVAGVPAVHDGQPTGALAGRAIRKTPREELRSEAQRSPKWAVEQLVERLEKHEGRVEPFSIDFERHRAPDAAERASLPIGVFDSGVGGVAVLETILTLDRHDNRTGRPGADGVPDFQHEQFVYLGDQANMPYGNYPAVGREDYLRELILKDSLFLLGNRHWSSPEARQPTHDKRPVKAIVIACNTATAYGLEDLRGALERWKLDVPVVGVVEAGAQSVAAGLPREGEPDAVAVLATVGTCSSEAYPRAINRAAGLAGVRAPPVWQRGSVGLAGAIEGSPATAAGLDPQLADVYQFEPAGATGGPDKLDSWKITSVENWVRYETTTMVEQYRRSGAVKPIRQVVLGCTHYPYAASQIDSALRRLRDYRNAQGEQPYRALIAEQVTLVDPGVLTAERLYRDLFLGRRLRRTPAEGTAPTATEEGGRPRVEALYLSTPAAGVPGDRLTTEGGFTAAYKYGRRAGEFELEEVRVSPTTRATLPPSARMLLETHCPRVWASLPN